MKADWMSKRISENYKISYLEEFVVSNLSKSNFLKI
jgi:hypothetical protein